MPMDTLPMPLDQVAATHGGLDEFRITAPGEIAAMLKRFADGAVTLNLNAPDGSAATATLWTIDSARGLITFSADADDLPLQALIECDEAVVVGYLDNVKVQFDVHDLVLVHNGRSAALNCAFPQQMFRFQRRNAFRVRPLMRHAPVARLRHPMIAEMQLALRVLDVSITGCALFLPEDVPKVDPGLVLNNVQIELDADTRLQTALRIMHVSSIHPGATGLRLGCEFVRTQRESMTALQRYIDQTQKRRRLMVLD